MAASNLPPYPGTLQILNNSFCDPNNPLTKTLQIKPESGWHEGCTYQIQKLRQAARHGGLRLLPVTLEPWLRGIRPRHCKHIARANCSAIQRPFPGFRQLIPDWRRRANPVHYAGGLVG